MYRVTSYWYCIEPGGDENFGSWNARERSLLRTSRSLPDSSGISASHDVPSWLFKMKRILVGRVLGVASASPANLETSFPFLCSESVIGVSPIPLTTGETSPAGASRSHLGSRLGSLIPSCGTETFPDVDGKFSSADCLLNK